jgi:hypothetical protein
VGHQLLEAALPSAPVRVFPAQGQQLVSGLGADAVAGPTGTDKTSTVLTAVVAGARMVVNDKRYACTDTDGNHGRRPRSRKDVGSTCPEPE